MVLGPGISHQAESGALGAASSLIPDQWGAAHRRRCAGASQRASQAQVGAGWTPPSWGAHAPRASSAHAARKRGRAGHPPRGSWGGHAPRASSTLAARIAGATQVLRRRLARALKKEKMGGGRNNRTAGNRQLTPKGEDGGWGWLWVPASLSKRKAGHPGLPLHISPTDGAAANTTQRKRMGSGGGSGSRHPPSAESGVLGAAFTLIPGQWGATSHQRELKRGNRGTLN